MIKEIYLILSHTPSFEKQQMLRSLVHSINKQGKQVMLVSHTQIPKDIEDMCDYTIFDRENKLIYDPTSQFWSYSVLANKRFDFINLTSAITILPVCKLLFGGMSYLKTLGYDIVHLLEYDCELNDFTHFNDALGTITRGEYDLVGFKPERDYEEKHLLLPISFNIKKISFDQLIYDENYLLSEYKRRYCNRLFPVTEGLIYDMLWSKLNIKIENGDEVKATMKINQNYTLVAPTNKYCLHTINGVLHLTHENLNKLDGNIIDLIVIDKAKNSKTKTFITPYYNCVWVNLEVNYADAVHIKIFVNNTLFRELDLTNPNDRFYIDSTKVIDL
jgi:hypothetical protein